MDNFSVKEAIEELSHAGVLGMRWGVRKDKKKKIKSADHDKVKALKKKSASELSDDEIRKVANRIRLEEDYRKLNPTRKQKAKAFVGDALGRLGNQVLSKVIEQGATKIATQVMLKVVKAP